jgi:hypothetical protein
VERLGGFARALPARDLLLRRDVELLHGRVGALPVRGLDVAAAADLAPLGPRALVGLLPRAQLAEAAVRGRAVGEDDAHGAGLARRGHGRRHADDGPGEPPGAAAGHLGQHAAPDLRARGR